MIQALIQVIVSYITYLTDLSKSVILTSNALVQHTNYFLEGLALLERVQVAYSIFGKPAYDEIHSVQLSFR